VETMVCGDKSSIYSYFIYLAIYFYPMEWPSNYTISPLLVLAIHITAGNGKFGIRLKKHNFVCSKYRTSWRGTLRTTHNLHIFTTFFRKFTWSQRVVSIWQWNCDFLCTPTHFIPATSFL